MAWISLPSHPIYPGILALFVAASAGALCRADLWCNTAIGGLLLCTDAVFLLGLKVLWPRYIEAVWRLGALIDWQPAGVPSEELLFGIGFGMHWSSVYDHVAGRTRARESIVLEA